MPDVDQSKDWWNRAEIGSKVFAAIVVPVVLGFFGWRIQLSLQQADVGARMVEMAVEILRLDPSADETEPDAMRQWAIDLLSHYSDVPIPDDMREQLLQRPFPDPGLIDYLTGDVSVTGVLIGSTVRYRNCGLSIADVGDACDDVAWQEALGLDTYTGRHARAVVAASISRPRPD